MADDLDDTDEWVVPPELLAKKTGPLTKEKAIAIMHGDMPYSSNANGHAHGMVKYMNLFKDDAEALELSTETTTQYPYGEARQVTDWGAIRHTERQFEVPIEILEKAAGMTYEEAQKLKAGPRVAPKGIKPDAVGERGIQPGNVKDRPGGSSEVMP